MPYHVVTASRAVYRPLRRCLISLIMIYCRRLMIMIIIWMLRPLPLRTADDSLMALSDATFPRYVPASAGQRYAGFQDAYYAAWYIILSDADFCCWYLKLWYDIILLDTHLPPPRHTKTFFLLAPPRAIRLPFPPSKAKSRMHAVTTSKMAAVLVDGDIDNIREMEMQNVPNMHADWLYTIFRPPRAWVYWWLLMNFGCQFLPAKRYRLTLEHL